MQAKQCEQCGTEFQRHRKYSQKQWDEKRYCSLRCVGDSKIGGTHTDETRAKLSAAHKGTRKPWAGKYKRSEAHREAVSRQNQNLSPEKKAAKSKKLSMAHKGRERNEEFREKMREVAERRPSYKGGAATRAERRAFCQRRREATKRVNGSHSLDQWEGMKKAYQQTCPACLTSEPKITLTQDHIIPISAGGSDNIENIQPLCRGCNSRKMTTPVTYLPPQRFATKEYLWRPIQLAMTDKKSTTEITTVEPTDIHAVLSRHLGERLGVRCPEWPKRDQEAA